MEKYLEGEEISEDEIRKALRKGTLAMKIVPVVTGSAFKNKGVQTLLDAVVDICRVRWTFRQSKVSIRERMRLKHGKQIQVRRFQVWFLN